LDALDAHELVAGALAADDAHALHANARPARYQAAQRLVGATLLRRRADAHLHDAVALAGDLIRPRRRLQAHPDHALRHERAPPGRQSMTWALRRRFTNSTTPTM